MDADSIIKSVVVSVGIAFVTPALVQIVRVVLGTGTFAIGAILSPITRMLSGLLWIGKYVSIPLAAFVLFAPESLHSLFPSSSTVLGICILLIASVYLIFAMFTGLREALAICFWASICLVIASAFHLDKMLPKGEVKRVLASAAQSSSFQSIQESLRSSSSSQPTKEATKGESQLEFSTFDAHPKAAVKAEDPLSLGLGTITQAASQHYSAVEGQVTEFLSPALNMVNRRDQGFKGLPSNMFFAKSSSKQRFGFSGGSGAEVDSKIGGIEAYLTNLLK